jgi:transposase
LLGWSQPHPAHPATVAAFAVDLTEHGGDPAAVAELCIDMSSAFIRGTTKHLPQAEFTCDKFHAVKIVNGSSDPDRRLFTASEARAAGRGGHAQARAAHESAHEEAP